MLALWWLSAAVSKLPESRVATTEACDSAELPAPAVVVGGATIEPPISETIELRDGRMVALRTLHAELQLTYAHGLVAAEELEALVRLAESRGGFRRSPLRRQRSDGEIKDDIRNSSSCPLLWPMVYAGRTHEVAAAANGAALLEELSLATRISERVADLFSRSGMPTTAAHVEPLQLVRYQASELFGPHHDYHESPSSSVQGEQRSFTVLLFGSTLPPGSGGETRFPLLDVSVSPRTGDALIWANLLDDGTPNVRSLHEGRPPASGEKLAVNVWVADRPFDSSSDLERAVRT